MSNESIKEFEDLRNLLLQEEDGFEAYNNLLTMLGIENSTIENIFPNKLDLEYVSETEKELSYAYPSDSGFDLYSAEEIELGPFGRALVPTGVRFNLPEGYEIQVRSKSGLAINQGLMVLNSPGTVDQGYTGEIKVIIFNTTQELIDISKGQKIAQGVLSPVVCGKWITLKKVKNVEDKDRSDKGFGSTGI